MFFFTLLLFSWAGWLSSIPFVRYSKDMQHGNVAWTCSIKMQPRNAALDLQHGRAAGMQYEHAIWRCWMDMQYGNTAVTCSIYM
jgi:hypothetical protein